MADELLRCKEIEFSLPYHQDVGHYLQEKYSNYPCRRILSKSLDARKANRGRIPIYQYKILLAMSPGDFPQKSVAPTTVNLEEVAEVSPIIVGAGPAGLFCALYLAEAGLRPRVIERGPPAGERMRHIAEFWRKGKLRASSNVCYGEGGAGLFSDGKLMTRVKSPWISYVMRKLVEFGAPEEVAYESNPHLGSNKIRALIPRISKRIEELGGEFHYNTHVTKLLTDEHKKVQGVGLAEGNELKSQAVVLAPGHSSTQLYEHLLDVGVKLKAKSFALGVRIEHPRPLMNKLQYGNYAPESERGEGGLLPTANYRWRFHHKSVQRSIYSFCMCPGGYVLSSGTEQEGMVTNGMSNYSRHSPWSNAAIVVEVIAGRDFATGTSPESVLDGLKLQREIEEKAYQLSKKEASGKEMPAVGLLEFMQGDRKMKRQLPANSNPSGIFPADFSKIFPAFVLDSLRAAFKHFERHLPGLICPEAILIAPETRTSSPVTIEREGETCMSVSHQGLYPCGEGAGYAGGITSAAVDGIRVARVLAGHSKKEGPKDSKN